MDSVTPYVSVLGRSLTDLRECTLSTCPVETSFYFYRVSLPANAVFAALFGLSLLGYIGVFAATRRASAFSFAMVAGTFLEVLGYAGRLMSWKNPWNEDGFMMQIVCLTIAPAFMAGGIYLCLRRIVYAFGADGSRIKPELYTRIVSAVPETHMGHHPLTTTHSSSPATSCPSSCRQPAAASRPRKPTPTKIPRSGTTS